MVIPYAAGGAYDVLGRILAPGISDLLGQQIVIENVTGAGGMVGAARVAKAPPDGYQFVLGGIGTHAHNQTLYKNPLYNAAADFAPVVLLVEQPTIVIARNDLPAGNLREFIAYARDKQATMQYGSAGVGSPGHLACALLNFAIGIKVPHVPYRGATLAMQDLIAGRLDYQCLNASSAVQQIEGGLVKAITILAKNRSPILPNLTSAKEEGLNDFEANQWFAFFLPRDTPAPIVRKLHDAAVATMESAPVRQKLKELGAEVVAPDRRSPDYLGKFVRDEIDKWAAAIKAAGLAGQ